MKYHYVLTVQYNDRRGQPHIQTFEGPAYFDADQGESARYDHLKAEMKRKLEIPGEPATLFYRCVLDDAAEAMATAAV